ncbi:MAG: hypothetical protein GF331_00570 [Chitinivibrionales bacterium]|nr:hypothetical protein [Chitinivibrionales bacterium]
MSRYLNHRGPVRRLTSRPRHPSKGESMRAIVTLLTALGLCTAAAAAAIDLDPSTQHQTMEGMGAAVAEWLYSQNNSQQIMDMMVQDLGASMLRVYPEQDFEPSPGNFNPNASRTSAQFEVVKKAVNAGIERVLLSPFSPPAWMKTNGEIENGGHLLADKYDDFAEYFSRYVQAMNAEMGKDVVYAVSPQNEPEWAQWYASCVYTYEEMRDVTKAIGLRLEADGLDCRIFGAETVVSANWGPYYGYTMQDPTAKRLLDVLAVHAYENNGVTASSPSAQKWRMVRDAAATHGKGVWMTETSGFDAGFDDALEYANGIYTSLKYGDLSGWVFLNFNTSSGANEQEALCIDGNPKKLYYTSKNYYKWIRPGAVRITSTSSDENVLAVAFIHPQNETMTIVLTNTGTASTTATLNGVGLPSFTAYRSSSSENCIEVNSVSGNTVTLPAQSITTLYGTGFTVAVKNPARRSPTVPRHTAPSDGVIYNLNGRRMPRTAHGGMQTRSIHLPAGVYCVRRSVRDDAAVPVVR